MEMDGPPSPSEGIYKAEFDSTAGTLASLQLVAEVGCSPSWFRWHPSLPVLYTTNETFDGSASSITAFRLTPSCGLERMGRVSTGGGSACHFSLHPGCRFLAAANHGQDLGGDAGGSVAVISLCPQGGNVLDQTDFVLHSAPPEGERPAGRENWTPHAHSATWSPCGKYLFVCEKGTDRIIVCEYDMTPPPKLAMAVRWMIPRSSRRSKATAAHVGGGQQMNRITHGRNLSRHVTPSATPTTVTA